MISRRWFLTLAGMAWVMRPDSQLWAREAVPAELDHILLGVSDLESGIAWVEQRTGVRAAVGGVHPGRGTRNALLSLGSRHYLEIIAPDPQQPGIGMYDRLSAMKEPRLFDWAVHTNDIDAAAKRAVAAGFAIDGPRDGSRARPDGKTLHWKSFNLKDDRGGLLPFFIEWGRESVHPSEDAPKGCTLKRFWLELPAEGELAKECKNLGVEVAVERAKQARLRAVIATPKGDIEL
ncbi:MAG TPA: VOC family protein [Candidatus Angelobacter sp.]